MKRFLKRTLAMFLCLIMVMGMGLVSGVISAPVASAAETAVGAAPKAVKYDGTSEVLDATGVMSYDDLVAEYGTATGADGLTDGFLYVATEYYEKDGRPTDYYVKPGDKLTAKVYIKSNMKTGDGYIISFYNNSHWDVKVVSDGATTDKNGYTSNYSGGEVNPNHPAIVTNGYGCTITSINITNVGWIKNTCGLDTKYLAATDLVQTNTVTNIDVGTPAYQMTSDEWVYTYYVTVKEGLEDGTELVVESPDVIWHSYINPATSKHDFRKKAYVGCGHITNTAVTDTTNVKTMASQMDSGALDYFINGLDHTFVIGEPPVPGAAKTATFMVDGEVYGEVKEYEEGETIVVPADPEKEGHTFAGWDTTPGVMGTESLVFNATWTAIKYDVSFDNDGEVTSDEFDFGSTVTLPTPAAKKGHSFVGWFDEEGNEFTAESTVPVGGVSLTAKYEKNTYNAIFDADGGAWADGDSVKTVPTEYDAQIAAPADPEKEGYTFTGWTPEVLDIMPDKNLTYTATWEVNEYTVTWDVDGETTEEIYEYGAEIVAPADPVKEGYTFTGWDAEIPEAMPAEDLTFTATWDVNEYTVTWDVDGETTEEIYEYGAEIVAPADPEKEGYTFTGWDAEIPSAMPAENLTFTATWEVNEHTVTWDADGETTEEIYEYGAKIVAPADPVKEGYTFTGWTPEVLDIMPDENLTYTATWEVNEYTVTWDVDGETTEEIYEYGAEIVAPADPEKIGYTFTGWDAEVPEAMPAENIVLTATWSKNSYNAIFNANGGAFADGSETATVATEYEAAVVAPEAPVCEGFTFVGWTPELTDSMPAESVTYIAVWAEGEGVPYTVETYTMDVNGNYGEAEVAYYATEDATATVVPEAAEGFTVAEKSVLEAAAAADGSTVLKVYFERNKYTVEFNANGGIIDDGAALVVEYYYGAEIGEPAAPVKDEYTFVGWDAEIPETMPAEDLVFTATWELAHTHELTLVTEEATCTEDGKKYYVCADCGETVGEVEVIAAKGHIAGEWTVETEATTEAEGEAVKRCTVCNEIVETSVISKLPVPPATIITDDGETFVSGSEVVYGESVTLTVGNLPEGSTVEWTVEGEGVEIIVSEDGKTCTVTSVSSGKATVKATVTDANGNKTVTTTEIVSDACFFQRLVHFLKNIFSFNILGYIFGLFF